MPARVALQRVVVEPARFVHAAESSSRVGSQGHHARLQEHLRGPELFERAPRSIQRQLLVAALPRDLGLDRVVVGARAGALVLFARAHERLLQDAGAEHVHELADEPRRHHGRTRGPDAQRADEALVVGEQALDHGRRLACAQAREPGLGPAERPLVEG
jgi:hypothetical protein